MWEVDYKVKAYVFSIGEKTTDLCCELMEKYGFEVVLYQDETSLWEKLKRFYTEALATDDKTFIRIDADIIPNSNVQELVANHHKETVAWTCAVGWDWYKQDRGAISIHVMDQEIVAGCCLYIELAEDQPRPETYLWRLPTVNPYTRIDESKSFGIHGYGQVDQRDRIKTLKHVRGQEYDWELLDRIEAL